MRPRFSVISILTCTAVIASLSMSLGVSVATADEPSGCSAPLDASFSSLSYPQQQFKQRLDKATCGSCRPGTKVVYRNVTSDMPFIELDYIDGGRAVPNVCKPKDGKFTCEPMLTDGMSFKVSDLESKTKNTPNDENGFEKRLLKILRTTVKVAKTVADYTAFALPVGGDGVVAFLSDMNDHVSDSEKDEKKAKDAAKLMQGIFAGLLSCQDMTHASYHDGVGLEKGLDDLFINLSQDPKIDMGDQNANKAQLDKFFEALTKSQESINKIQVKSPEYTGMIVDDRHEAKPLSPQTSGVVNVPASNVNAGSATSN